MIGTSSNTIRLIGLMTGYSESTWESTTRLDFSQEEKPVLKLGSKSELQNLNLQNLNFRPNVASSQRMKAGSQTAETKQFESNYSLKLIK